MYNVAFKVATRMSPEIILRLHYIILSGKRILYQVYGLSQCNVYVILFLKAI